MGPSWWGSDALEMWRGGASCLSLEMRACLAEEELALVVRRGASPSSGKQGALLVRGGASFTHGAGRQASFSWWSGVEGELSPPEAASVAVLGAAWQRQLPFHRHVLGGQGNSSCGKRERMSSQGCRLPELVPRAAWLDLAGPCRSSCWRPGMPGSGYTLTFWEGSVHACCC